MGPAPAAYEQLELDNHESSIRTTFSGSGFENVQDVSIRKHTYVATVRLLSYFLIFCATSLLILTLIELVMIYRTSSSNGESIMSIASLKLFSGSCNSDLHNYAIGIHFVINLFGTLVLASSNYLQQICSSPDYSEIIRQMQERGDILFGANSFLSVIRQKSTSLKVLWFSLLLSSLPLHIMLNGTLGYAVHPVSSVRGTAGVQINGTDLVNATEISADECVSYLLSSTAYVTDYDAMFVVLQPDAENSSTEYNGFAGAQGQWYPNFTPKSSDIVTCYIDKFDSTCILTVRWFPLLITALSITVKSIIVFIGIRRHSQFKKRVFNSLGDMITLGARRRELAQSAIDSKLTRDRTGGMYRGPAKRAGIRWVRALGRFDLGVAIFWWASVLGVSIYGAYAWVYLSPGLGFADRLKKYGLGTIDPATSFVPGSSLGPFALAFASQLPILTIVANSPQIWLSIGYLLWNNQITRIYTEHEWRKYYCKPQHPRVSYETKDPRVKATRWLQLPYYVTALLMLINTTLHWLVSQTMFVVEILGDSVTMNDSTYYINFSPLAIFCIGAASSILVVTITIYYFIPVKTWMPLLANSGRLVFESCEQLSYVDLPEDGLVAWGDVSAEDRNLAGFGKEVSNVKTGVYYPSPRLQGSIRESYSDSHPLLRE